MSKKYFILLLKNLHWCCVLNANAHGSHGNSCAPRLLGTRLGYILYRNYSLCSTLQQSRSSLDRLYLLARPPTIRWKILLLMRLRWIFFHKNNYACIRRWCRYLPASVPSRILVRIIVLWLKNPPTYVSI